MLYIDIYTHPPTPWGLQACEASWCLHPSPVPSPWAQKLPPQDPSRPWTPPPNIFQLLAPGGCEKTKENQSCLLPGVILVLLGAPLALLGLIIAHLRAILEPPWVNLSSRTAQNAPEMVQDSSGFTSTKINFSYTVCTLSFLMLSSRHLAL